MSRLSDIAEQALSLVDTGAEAEATVIDGLSALTRFANSYIHQNVADEGTRVTLKVALDGKVASATTNLVGPEGLRALAEKVTASARLQPVDPDWPGLTPPTPVTALDHWDEATATASPAERATIASDFIGAVPGFDAAGFCETTATRALFANSAGHTAEDRSTTAALDGIHRDGTIAGSGHASSIRIGDIDGAVVGDVAGRRAVASRGAVDVKAGARQVVLAPECLATVCIFMSVYGFNAKAHLESQSFVRPGDIQFDEAFQLRDDANDTRSLAIGFDSEGSPKQSIRLVEDGKSMALVHDRRTAAKVGSATTGNSLTFFGGYFGPLATDLFVKPGSMSEDEMISSVEQGLYVSTFNYCRVLDPKTLVVTGLTRNGTFLIENGKLTTPVTNLRFTQSFVEALSPGRILGLGSNDRFADSEYGAGMVHCPSVTLESWNFTGDASG